MDIAAEMNKIGQQAKMASAELAFASGAVKQQALENAADAVWDARADIIAANADDMEYGRKKGLSPA